MSLVDERTLCDPIQKEESRSSQDSVQEARVGRAPHSALTVTDNYKAY